MRFLEFFFPKTCLSCHVEGFDFCPKCVAQTKRLQPFSINIAGQEIEVLSCFEYGQISSQLLKSLKYYEKAENAKLLAEFIYKFYLQQLKEADFLIPIGTHFLKRVKRKYNTPHLICLHLEKKLQAKTLAFALSKKGFWPKSQVGLTREERILNLKNTFKTPANLNLQGKNVVIIDDVITTGATAENAVLEILKHNPKQVKVATFAAKMLD